MKSFKKFTWVMIILFAAKSISAKTYNYLNY